MQDSLTRRLKTKIWPRRPITEHLYRAAVVAGLLAIAVLLADQASLSRALFFLSWALACAGFGTWLIKHAINLWKFEVSRALVAWSHAAMLLGAYLLSRWCVALTLGLPAKDFDGAVAIMTILCACVVYIAMILLGCMVIAVGCLILAPVLESAWLISTFPEGERLRQYLSEQFGIRFFKQPSPGPRPSGLSLLAHLSGGLCVIFALVGSIQPILDFSINNIELTRRVAFYADYHLQERYPGITPGQRFILHDNNVISIAREVDGKVEIAVGVIDPLKGITVLSPYL